MIQKMMNKEKNIKTNKMNSLKIKLIMKKKLHYQNNKFYIFYKYIEFL